MLTQKVTAIYCIARLAMKKSELPSKLWQLRCQNTS